jgi:sugar lactone lactonase YvrE
VVAPDRSTVVQAEAMTTGTRVVESDAATGAVRWTHDVPGRHHVRVVSPGGRFVALVDGDLSFASTARAATTVVVATATGTHSYRFAGNLDPEAFSTDGRTLFVLDFLPAMQPTRYSVREVDLASGAIRAVPDRDGSVRAPMPGYARAQVMSPDGHQLYTFYASSEPVAGDDGDEYHTWIHVLNVEQKWAHCLELDEKIGVNASPALAVSADSAQLYVSDRATGALVAIDTRTLHVEHTRFVSSLRNAYADTGYATGALLAVDGPTLFLNAASRGVTRVDARTLEPEPGVIAPTQQVVDLHVDRSGRALYVLAADGLFVLAPDGRQLARWSAPGDATSIAPPVVPGRGTYGCAC